MDDYLSEAEQWEWLKGQIREYGLWILGGVILGGVGIAGWLAWQSHVDRAALAASAQYESVRSAFGGNDRAKAMAALGELERDHPGSPYVDQARLLVARSYVESNELDKAATELQRVTDTTHDHELSLLTRLRLARVQIARNKPDEALTTLNAVKPGAFEARYHEVRGDAFFAKGDKAQALSEYRAAQLANLTGGGDHALLDLKVADLLTQVPPKSPVPAAPVAPAK